MPISSSSNRTSMRIVDSLYAEILCRGGRGVAAASAGEGPGSTRGCGTGATIFFGGAGGGASCLGRGLTAIGFGALLGAGDSATVDSSASSSAAEVGTGVTALRRL